MVRSAATTVQDYLDGLEPERAEAVAAVRQVVNDNLPAGYQEGMAFGVITWSVPLSTYPDTYNSCINFRSADELPLDAVGEIIRRSDVETYVAAAKAARTKA